MAPLQKTYFDSFRKVVKAINSTLDLQEVMDLMVKSLVEVMGVKAAAIRLLNPKKRTLELLASHGLSDKYIRKGPLDASRSIAEAMEGKVVVLSDARRDPRAQYQSQASEEGIATIVSVPLNLKGRIIGVLRLYTGSPKDFSEEELDFAQSLAEMGAIAIENAKMYERIKKDYESIINETHSIGTIKSMFRKEEE
ncbi:MAG TPA: GAF domain-containing protein [Syntrophobacter fumaroxidans]|nr:GAF domain-containing protein [Syntrophobacter fumaroxidans]